MSKTLNSAIFCLVTSFLSVLAYGQETSAPKESPFAAKSYEKFAWGFRGGLNMTTAHFADVDARESLDAKPSLGWTIGALAKFKLTNQYDFQTEIGFTQKTSTFSFDGGTNQNEMLMQFVDISMLLKRRFNFTWGKDIHSDIFIGIGPNINYWLNANGKISYGDGPGIEYEVVMNGTPDANYNNLYLNGVNKWLFGIDLGIGANAPITPKQKIYVEFRASFGQTNLGTNGSTSFINIIGFVGSDFQENLLKANLKTFSITAAYTFSFNYLESKTGHSTKDKLVKKRKPNRIKKRRR